MIAFSWAIVASFAEAWIEIGDSAGFIAIKIMNALSTGGFKIKSDDKSKGNFDFEYTGHYSIKNAETVPYEVYIKTGEAA